MVPDNHWMDFQWLIEPAGAFFGLLGTVLLAHNGRWAGWGFVVYLASNIAWMLFSVLHEHWYLLAQYVGFTAVSLYGVWRWLVVPRQARAVAPSS